MQQKRIVGESQALLNEKAAQAQAAQADMTRQEKLEAYKQTPEYLERQAALAAYQREKAYQAYRAGEREAVSIAEAYKAQEQARQNAVSAARWAGVTSVAVAKEEKKPWWEQAWDAAKNIAQEYVIQPAKTFWDEKIYKPYVKPVENWVQEKIQLAKDIWNEKVYKPYIQPVVKTVQEKVADTWNSVKGVFQENPKAAWSTAAVVTTATIAGTVYYINCYGTPSFTPPVSSLINFAGMFSLPLTGWLTTSKKQRLYGILVGMLMLGMLLSACGGGTPGNTPVAPPTGNALCPEPNTPVPTETQPPPTATVLSFVVLQDPSEQIVYPEQINGYNFITRTMQNAPQPFIIDLEGDNGVYSESKLV
jgi:hypothetical protein